MSGTSHFSFAREERGDEIQTFGEGALGIHQSMHKFL